MAEAEDRHAEAVAAVRGRLVSDGALDDSIYTRIGTWIPVTEQTAREIRDGTYIDPVLGVWPASEDDEG